MASVQVTALGVVQEDGTTGRLPTNVNFQVTNGAISFPASFGASSGPAVGHSQVAAAVADLPAALMLHSACMTYG